MGGRSILAALSLAILSAVSSSDAAAATLRECRATCAPRAEDECADLARRKARKCRKRIVRACRRTGLERCLPATTTTTVTPTTEPAASTTTTTTSTATLPTELCGNGVIDSGEVCDGPSLGDAPYCLRGGPVTCGSSCRSWDYSACYRCQNGIREGLEECDGDDLGSATCPVGSTGGSPVCMMNCRLDYAPCVQCGDGNLDPGEYCDDGNTDAHDGCSPTCQSECGDGIVEPEEACDDGAHANGDGCNAFCEIPMPYAGGGNEPDDVCALQWGAASDAPLGATLTCTDGQSPCDRGPASDETCRFLVYFCVNNPSFTVACPWSGVSRVALVGDSLSGASALSDSEQTIVLDAFGTALAWAGSVVSGTNPERAVTPVSTAGDCGQFELDVPSGSTRTVAVQIEDGHVPAGLDADELTLDCAAP